MSTDIAGDVSVLAYIGGDVGPVLTDNGGDVLICIRIATDVGW